MLSTRSPVDVDRWYDEIRAQIRTRDGTREDRHGGLVVALTSLKSGEGVTTAALGLAKSFEREIGGNVLMILAKETPGQFASIFVGVKPRVIDDDLLFAAADDGQGNRWEPYVALPPSLDRQAPSLDAQPEAAIDIRVEPGEDNVTVPTPRHDERIAEHMEPLDEAGGVVALPENVIERFGGIRPMARAMNVPASTVASWKRRGRIPSHRRRDIIEALGDVRTMEPPNGVDLASMETSDSPPEPTGASLLDEPPELLARQLLVSDGLPAAGVINFFGGVQPLANALDMPVTTVQAWQAENHIPDLYHATIRLAARDCGGDLDDIGMAPVPARERERPPLRPTPGPTPGPTMPLEPVSLPSTDILPIWQADTANPDERLIVSLGERGPHVMAIGTCGLNGSGYGRRWKNTFTELRGTFDVIIVDTGSLETPIPRMWRDQTSQTLLVIDSTKTSAKELRRLSRLSDLPSLGLSGTILNKVAR